VLRKYRFEDTDQSGNADFDIDGVCFSALLNVCIKYCKYMAFVVKDESIAIPDSTYK